MMFKGEESDHKVFNKFSFRKCEISLGEAVSWKERYVMKWKLYDSLSFLGGKLSLSSGCAVAVTARTILVLINVVKCGKFLH